MGNLYPPAATGGYERILRGCVLALRAAGHEVEVLTTAPVPGALVDEEVDPGVRRALRWYWRDFAWPAMSHREVLGLERHNRAALRRTLEEVRPDVVAWWQLGGMSLSAVELVRRAGVRSIGLVGDDWMTYGPVHDRWHETWGWHPRWQRLGAALTGVPTRLRLADGARWLFISEFLRERAVARHGPLPDTGLLHPGVSPERFPAAPAAPWSGRLAYVGRVEEGKGVHVAVEALAELPASYRLVVDGPANDAYAGRLRALAAQRGVADRLELRRTPSAEVARAYAGADCILFPNLWDEPWGLVPLEAMSVGRPVVSTATGGSAEFLLHERTCLRIPREDPRALAAAVLRLEREPALREALVVAGRERVAGLTEAAFEAGYVAEVEALAHRASSAA